MLCSWDPLESLYTRECMINTVLAHGVNLILKCTKHQPLLPFIERSMAICIVRKLFPLQLLWLYRRPTVNMKLQTGQIEGYRETQIKNTQPWFRLFPFLWFSGSIRAHCPLCVFKGESKVYRVTCEQSHCSVCSSMKKSGQWVEDPCILLACDGYKCHLFLFVVKEVQWWNFHWQIS